MVLESTTWPGTTRELLQPILEEGSGLRVGEGFFLAMSPERVDPGREDWTAKTTPKVLGGITPECTRRAAELYRRAVDTVHELTSPEAAELTKLLENIFRSVNIALVNELAILCDRMGIDIWEVVDAAATKPFGYMRFSPGPGLGGHCIPVDPFYLSLEGARVRLLHGVRRARRQGQRGDAVLLPLARLAGAQPPRAARDEGLADPRARRRVQAGHRRPARVAGAEAHLAAAERRRRGLVPRPARPRASTSRASSFRRSRTSRGKYDCVVIVTDHSSLDYEALVDEAPLVVDLRNATGAKGSAAEHVFKL